MLNDRISSSLSVIKSSSVGNDYFVKCYTSNHCSMFDEQINSNNQRKDDDNHHQVSMRVQFIFVKIDKDKKKRQFDMPKSKTCRFSLPIMVIDVSLSLFSSCSITLHTQIFVSSSLLHELLL